MKEQPKKEVHHNAEVWVNRTTESLRRSDCLCLNCGNLSLDGSNKCPIANQLYQICVNQNVALAVTRCPTWKPQTP